MKIDLSSKGKIWYKSLSSEQKKTYTELHPDSPYVPLKPLRTVPDLGPDPYPALGIPVSGRLQFTPTTNIVGVQGKYGIPGISSNEAKLIVSPSISLSRKHSHKSPRASFMSKLMTLLGGDTGNAIANAFVAQKAEKFEELMGDVVKKMSASIKRTQPKVEASLSNENSFRSKLTGSGVDKTIQDALFLAIKGANSISSPSAKAYANAMELSLDEYGLDGLKHQVMYLLINLSQWKGDTAASSKKLLKKWAST